MRQAALRTLLVVSERPHPWAFLRDRLDPDLVTVSWTRPADAGRAPAPWMLAGSGDAAGAMAAYRDRPICWRWVGPPPAGLPVEPRTCRDWQHVADDAERALAARVAGVRLAPGRGLVLPDGSYLPGAAALEAALAAHPEAIAVGAATPRLRADVRRGADLLRRHGLPLRLTRSGRRLALTETPDGAGDDRPD